MLPTMGPVAGGPPPFGIGDWWVTGIETLENGCLMLDGDLTILNGASLTLSNFSLTVHCDYCGEHALTVRSGGTLRILNGSMVNSLGEWWTFNFTINQGATVDFEDSTFATCGARGLGIWDLSDDTTIQNCTFTAAFYAMTLSGSRVNLRDCIFSKNYIGLKVLGSSDSVSNCTFTENGFGAWGGYSYEGCTFSGNAVGAWEIFRLTNCSFTGNYGMGIFVGNWITGCEFVNNTAAIDCGDIEADYHGWINLTNSNFSDNLHNVKYGRGYWNISRPCRVLNGTLDFDGNLTVKSGGTLSLSGSVLSMGRRDGGGDPIEVRTGGRLALADGSSIKAFNASFPYALRCLPGSAFDMSDSLLRDCGWDLSNPATAGPLIETDDLTIVSSTLDFNPAALVLNNSRGGIIEGSHLRGMESPLVLNASTLHMYNSTVDSAGDLAASLDNASSLDCVNSTLSGTLLRFGDRASSVNFSWYLDLQALWGDGSPAHGADVAVLDSSGAVVREGRTGDDGRMARIQLLEVSFRAGSKETFTPHRVNCSKGSITNETGITVDRSRSLVVYLFDDEPPVLRITHPLPGSELRSGSVVFNGTASDNLGVGRIELFLDSYRHFVLFDSAGVEVPTAGWNLLLELLEGPHTFEVAASDLSGNLASAGATVSVDFTAPRVRIASPPDGYLTNGSLLPVSGYMEPGCRVLLGSSEVRTERDTFGGTVVLGEGENLVTATAIDRAGNSNTSAVRVRLDTRPPPLDVVWPPEGLRTNMRVVAVNGTMEPGAAVSVNGRPVALTGEPGTFRTAIALTPETNLIVVDAVDPAGNHNLTYRTVVLDSRPPALEIESPAEGLLTNRSEVVLSGTTEGGAILSVDGAPSIVPGEPGSPARFAVPLRLSEGQNAVFVSAADGAGNLNSSTRHIVVDTQPPGLSISSPEAGFKTSRQSVFIVGLTEPGVVLTVNSVEVPVGQTGSFSLEVGLALGPNRITVRALDSAGNANETVVEVQKLAAAGDEILTAEVGPDWPFMGFIVMALGIAFVEGTLASRYLRKKAGV